jgi:hypothetical protein
MAGVRPTGFAGESKPPPRYYRAIPRYSLRYSALFTALLTALFRAIRTYHRSSTSSEQNPGPMAITIP